MTKARLLACPGCARHVRVSEPACVFCGLVLPKSFADKPALPRPPRMNRAGLFAYAGVLAASAAALVTSSCGGSLEAGSSEAGPQDGTSDTWLSGDEGLAVPYGLAPPPEDASSNTDSGPPDGNFADDAQPSDAEPDMRAVAAYGAAAPPDGEATDAETPDATDGAVRFYPPYGLPPPPP